MQPNFLVIGSAKCATTSLCGLLGAHPDVFMCQPKEPHFFAVDKVYNQGWQWYESLFANAQGKTAVGEGSTSYTKHSRYPEAAARIAQHLPDAKLIYMVRNPFEKVESLWMHARNNNLDVASSFCEAVRSNKTYIDEPLYWRQINYYRNHYPDDRILVLFYEEFKTSPAKAIEKCLRFLGVDPTVKIQSTRTRTNISHEDKILMRLLRKIPFFNTAYHSLPKRFQYSLNAKLRRPATSRPVWDNETRLWLFEQIAEDITQFLDFYGKPADYWFQEKPCTASTHDLS